MSKWKNGLAKRATAIILSGAVVMSNMTLSGMSVFAAESSEVEITEDAETQDETESASEETAEDEEVTHEVLEESETTLSIPLQEELKNAESTESSESDQSNQVIKFSLRMDEIDGNLTADYEKNGFTIKVKTGDTITVENNNKAVTGIKGMEGVTITKRLKTGGAGSAENRSIHFTAETPGTLVVYAASASGSEDRDLCLYKKGSTDVLVDTQQALGSGPTAIFYPIEEQGEYYVASNKAINFYYIQFSNEDENDDTEGDESEPYAPEEVDAEWTTFSTPEGDSVYNADEGTSNALIKYNQEGYAQAANVTGGGLLKEDSEYYKKVTNELEFIQALDAIRGDTEKPHVIEITTDLDLGNLSLNENFNLNIKATNDGDYNSVIRAQGAEPIMHPTLIKTGASYIKMHNFHNLTIFSKNGAMIKHCGIKIEGGTTNLIIRNIVFDELWEWDEEGSGRYKRNDWDYMTIENNSEGIWIDHCTFYKAYDGIIDLKNDSKYNGYQRVTISWCEVLPGSKNNTFFNEQMSWLEEHKDETTYYKSLFDENMKAPNADKKMTAQDIWWATYGHDKTHLLGAGDASTQDKAIRVTLANSYYKNARSRLPRLRFGKVHEYNCVLEAVELNEQYRLGNPHITGNGPASTCNGEMLIENCYVNGVRSPLRSGYGSPTGYIKAVDSIYRTDVKNNDGEYTYIERPFDVTDIITDTGVKAKVTDEALFREKLPYKNYTKYDASKLEELVLPYAGAGKLTMTTVQWERTSYNGEEGGGESGSEGSGTDESSNSEEGSKTDESSSAEESSSIGTSESGIRIVGLKESYPYTGDKITPAFDVYDYNIPGGKLLVQGIDYTVTYKDNKDVGTATIIVKGKGNYAVAKGKGNEATETFEIVAAEDAETDLANIKGAKISNKLDDVYYNKEPHNPPTITLSVKNKPDVTYSYNGTTGKYERADHEAMDVNIAVSNNVNKGTATVLVSGVDDKGKPVKIKGKFKIKPLDISSATVDVEGAKYAVNGAAPSLLKVTAAVGGTAEELKIGRDYTVKYSNNKKVGSAAVTVTGKGNYTGKVSNKPYDIAQADLSDYRVAAVTAHDGMKQAGKVKATVVDENGNALKASQYTLTIYKSADGALGSAYDPKDPLEKGVIYVQAVAKDTYNLTGATSLSDLEKAKFSVGTDISKAKVTAPDGKGVTKEYKGTPIILEGKDLKVTLKGVDGNLEIGTDYEIAAHSNNVSKGTATVVLKGIGKYSGTKTFKFKITQRIVSNVTKLEEVSKAAIDLLNSLSK